MARRLNTSSVDNLRFTEEKFEDIHLLVMQEFMCAHWTK